MEELRLCTVPEYQAALDLAWQVFCEFVAPDYEQQGVQAFEAFLNAERKKPSLQCVAVFSGDVLTGMLAWQEKVHICLCFVQRAFHHQGVGRRLVEAVCARVSAGTPVTVNASAYALGFYQRLGFVATAPEQQTDGIRYTPMCRLT